MSAVSYGFVNSGGQDRKVMTANLDEGIPILYIDGPIDGQKGLFSPSRPLLERLGTVDPNDLERNLSTVCARLISAFRGAQQAAGVFDLDAFEVTLDLTAKGEVRLIGSVSSEVHGGVKLTFRRRERLDA